MHEASATAGVAKTTSFKRAQNGRYHDFVMIYGFRGCKPTITKGGE